MTHIFKLSLFSSFTKSPPLLPPPSTTQVFRRSLHSVGPPPHRRNLYFKVRYEIFLLLLLWFSLKWNPMKGLWSKLGFGCMGHIFEPFPFNYKLIQALFWRAWWEKCWFCWDIIFKSRIGKFGSYAEKLGLWCISKGFTCFLSARNVVLVINCIKRGFGECRISFGEGWETKSECREQCLCHSLAEVCKWQCIWTRSLHAKVCGLASPNVLFLVFLTFYIVFS